MVQASKQKTQKISDISLIIYFLCPKIKGACILCDTFDPDEKVCNDLFTIFLVAPGVQYGNLEDGLNALTLMGTAATKVKEFEIENSPKTL